jgi:hypothetical protein
VGELIEMWAVYSFENEITPIAMFQSIDEAEAYVKGINIPCDIYPAGVLMKY